MVREPHPSSLNRMVNVKEIHDSSAGSLRDKRLTEGSSAGTKRLKNRRLCLLLRSQDTYFLPDSFLPRRQS